LGRLPISIVEDSTIDIVSNLTSLSKRVMEGHSKSRNVTNSLN
jgi:hypothetical protein